MADFLRSIATLTDPQAFLSPPPSVHLPSLDAMDLFFLRSDQLYLWEILYDWPSTARDGGRTRSALTALKRTVKRRRRGKRSPRVAEHPSAGDLGVALAGGRG